MVRSLSLQPSPNTEIGQANHLRTQSVNLGRNNQPAITSPVQDFFRRVRSANIEKSGGSMTDVSSIDGTEGLSTPGNSKEAETRFDAWAELPRGSPSPGSGYSTCSSTPVVDGAFVPFPRNEGSEMGLEISGFSHLKEERIHSSPPSVLVCAELAFYCGIWISGSKRSISSFIFCGI